MERKRKPIKQNAKHPEFAERIRKFMSNKTNKEIANITGLSEQVIGAYLNGQRMPLTLNIEQFQRLCEALDVSADQLLFGKEPQNKQKYLKISCQVFKTDGVRQMIFTATPTTETPSEPFEERRTKTDIYIDIP